MLLLVGTGLLYLLDLGASGWANSFYAAAVQAGTKSWKAFLFGSFDPSNFITVDKSPAALWVMELSGRVFGFNAWSMLVPQALEGVATVGLLYLAVRRWFTPAAGLVAGAVAALVPAAVLMFRFNNPDAFMTMLLALAAYATVRVVDEDRIGWSMLAGAAVGFAFLAKMLEAFLVVPALALVIVVAGHGGIRRRVRHLLWGGAAVAVSAGWWLLIVTMTPASARPYVGGSQDNSIWNLIFGYNGFGRLTGNEMGSVGGGPTGATSRWGPTGLTRLFGSEMGTQVSWLLPAAILLLVAGLIVTRRAPRTNRTRAGLLLWGGWLAVMGLAFSLGQGIIHPYYTVALAPAIGGLVGAGGSLMWSNRDKWVARWVLAGSVAATAVWAFVLLDRTPRSLPGLRPVILVAGLVGAAAVVAWPYLSSEFHAGAGRARARAFGSVVGGLAVVAALGGPLAYSIDTARTAHAGALPTAGPVGASAMGGPGGRFGAGGQPGGPQRGFQGGHRFGNPPQFGGLGGNPFAGGASPGGTQGGTGRTGGGNPAGGLLDASRPSAAMVTLLERNASRYEWVAAAVGANDAAGYQLATGDAVMAIGGFNGTDPDPTLAQFEKLVSEGKVHYFIAGGGFGGLGGTAGGASGGSSTATQITSWVEQHFTSTTVAGVTVYDLTSTGS
jgi:4-amino-4-deoxy-L-arabinose transferase-like glycosyltransferase